MYRKALISTLFLLCCSCANKVDTPVDKPNKQGAKPSVICSTSSPVFDKSKIAQMLKNNGKITAAMDADEIDKVVSDYIVRKNNSNKDCPKP